MTDNVINLPVEQITYEDIPVKDMLEGLANNCTDLEHVYVVGTKKEGGIEIYSSDSNMMEFLRAFEHFKQEWLKGRWG